MPHGEWCTASAARGVVRDEWRTGTTFSRRMAFVILLRLHRLRAMTGDLGNMAIPAEWEFAFPAADLTAPCSSMDRTSAS
ncbi:hypothetical protein PSAC2689_20449 [Paraburkholderia sacchari]